LPEASNGYQGKDRKEVAMDRDDAGMSDREEEARQGDTGMIGSESEEPGPGRDTSLTDPDPVAASTDQPRGTVAMSEGDPMRTRLGSHVEGAGVIGYDVAASEEGVTQETPADDRPGYEPERPGGGAAERDPGLATEPVVDQGAYEREPGGVGGAGYEGEPGGAGMAGYQEEPGQDVPATYTGEEADVTGRPEYADRAEGGDQPLYQEEPQRMDRPGGGGSLFTDEEPERLDRPGPQEPGVEDGVYDQESDQARQQRPADGL
jgi:hypothetical protein